MLNLSLSGCGFLGIYHIGVISAFKEHAPEIIEKSKIAGCSAGSLVAACALCNCCLGQMVSHVLEIALKARSRALGPLHPSFSIVDILRNGLRRVLPVDAHKICSGRLHVSLTVWKDGKNWLVNQFDSREELIQALICSSFVPCYSGFIPPKFRGVYCWDGGLSNNNPILDANTIVVSPFGGESDICPREESASYYCFDLQGTNIQWSKENFYRLSKALFPPSPQVLKAICFRGYKDSINFLKSRNLLRCSCQKNLDRSSIGSLMGDDLCDIRLFDDSDDNSSMVDSDHFSMVIGHNHIINNNSNSNNNITNNDNNNNQIYVDSDDDQIEQYAHSIEPLKYQEMPSPVCDILDAACADHKESLLSIVYNSQMCRAISILFLPYTLPIEFILSLTKRFIDSLPKVNLPNGSNNLLIDRLLFFYHLLIHKFTYDKYEYHARVSCKLCVKPHQIDSDVGDLKFSLCYHSAAAVVDAQSSIVTQNEGHNSQEHMDNHHHHHHHHQLFVDDDIDKRSTTTVSNYIVPKLCARHRLPSVLTFDQQEQGPGSITSSNLSYWQRKSFLMKKKRKKFQSFTNDSSASVYSGMDQETDTVKTHSLCDSSSIVSFSTNEQSGKQRSALFNRAKSERKLRRYRQRHALMNTNSTNSLPLSAITSPEATNGMLPTIPSKNEVEINLLSRHASKVCFNLHDDNEPSTTDSNMIIESTKPDIVPNESIRINDSSDDSSDEFESENNNRNSSPPLTSSTRKKLLNTQQSSKSSLLLLIPSHNKSNEQHKSNSVDNQSFNLQLLCDHEIFQTCDNCVTKQSPKQQQQQQKSIMDIDSTTNQPTTTTTTQQTPNTSQTNIDLDSYMDKLEFDLFGNINT